MKLYLALLWLSAMPPYDTTLATAKWATALDLKDPDTSGARRISDALIRLRELNLIKVVPRPGHPNRVVLLREDGSKKPYEVPHQSYRSAEDKEVHRYFKVPTELWTSGHMQNMSSAALAMLLVVLEESRGEFGPQWWSGDVFRTRFGLSKDVRAQGTKELEERGLLEVKRVPVGRFPGADSALETLRTRKTYALVNEAAGT